MADPATIAIGISLGVQAAGTVYNIVSGEEQKSEAKDSAEQIRADLDTLLGTEQGKLTTEFGVQKSRLQDYTKEVTGSQRQSFAVRGDFGGVDTAAAQVITATENKAASDQSLLESGYKAGMATLEQQTKLAKDQLDQSLNQTLDAITSSEINSVTGLVSNSLLTLGSMKLPASQTLMGESAAGANYNYGSMFGGAGWDPSLGIPRLG